MRAVLKAADSLTKPLPALGSLILARALPRREKDKEEMSVSLHFGSPILTATFLLSPPFPRPNFNQSSHTERTKNS